MRDGTPLGPLLFLSHAGADTGAARLLKQRIEQAPESRKRGLKVWFDKDNLRAGESWQKQLEDTIGQQATAFAVYVGSRGVINWVEAEVRLGLSRAIGGNGQHFPFIPVLAAGAVGSDALPGFARQFQAVRDVETNADEFQKLVAAVLGEAEAGSLPLEKEPFFGLKAIDETRSHLFFGRERETQELIERLSATHLLMVTGDSGSGKSSLVRAGLVPRWRGGALAELRGRRPDEEIWHVIETRPGSNPRRALADAVFAAAKRLGESAADCGTYKEWATSDEAEKVRDGLRCGLPADCTRTLVVVDQLEELMTLAPEEHRRAYVQLLLDLAAPKDESFAVVLTMRRDYYNLSSEFPPLYDRLEADNRRARYLLERMRDEDLRRVVTEPLKLAGVAPSEREALARSVLLDVGERPGDLALVQFALTATWDHRNEYDGDLLRSYTGIGRVEGALALAAKNVYAHILGGDAKETEIEAVFIRLVRLGDTGGATRRIARRGEFGDAGWRMLQALAEDRGNRLVLISGLEGDERIEIAHEALVTQWPRFQRWLQTAAGDKRVLDELIERAARWATPEGSPAIKVEQEALIDKATEPVKIDSKSRDQYRATGADLERFDKLEQRHKDWLSSTEVAYVTASKDAQQREERQRIRLFRTAVAASALFAVAALIAWLFYLSATKQTQIAREQTRTAIANESRALTGLSRVALEDGRPNQAAQLALAAWPRDDRDQHPRFETTLQNLSRAVSAGRIYLHQFQHGAPVTGAVMTKDETRILSWSNDKTLRLWDVATGQQIGPAMKHDNVVNGALLTKDETRILSWSGDHTLRLWDVATSRQIGPAMKHDSFVNGALLTKDETRILSWSDDETLRLWDVATGQEIGPAMKHDGDVNGAVLTKDGTRILSWSNDKTLRLWDVATGQEIGPAMKHDDTVFGALLTKDETRILSWSRDNTLRLWDVATGQQIGPAMKYDASVYGAVLTKDEARILSWSEDHTLRLWDVATGQEIGPAMKHDNVVNGALRTKDETRILSWSRDNTLRLWDVATGQEIGPAMKHDGDVNGAVLTKDGTRILSWSWDHTLRLWDVATGQEIGPAMKHDNVVNGALRTKDETRILSWSRDNTLRLWDVATGQQIGPAMKYDASVYGAVLTKDEARILSWSEDHTLRLWDVATNEIAERVTNHATTGASRLHAHLDLCVVPTLTLERLFASVVAEFAG